MWEGCTVCHTPHGSVSPKLLIQRDNNLCLRCHSQVQDGTGSLAIGKFDHTLSMRGRTCWSAGCHSGGARLQYQRQIPLLTQGSHALQAPTAQIIRSSESAPLRSRARPRCPRSFSLGRSVAPSALLCPIPHLQGASAELDPSKLPPSASNQVDFDRDIRPLLESHCFRCHGPERPKSGFRLDSRASALKGGEHGVDIVPGQSAKSPLVYYVARVVEDMEMPPAGKGEPLTREEVGLLRAWIDQGAPWPETGTKSRTLFSVKPSLAWITVSGNKQEFREQTGLKEGWSGGLTEFQLQERTSGGIKLDVDGRVLGNQDDYLVKVNVEKRDLGFLRFGYDSFVGTTTTPADLRACTRRTPSVCGRISMWTSAGLGLTWGSHCPTGRAWC